MQTIAPTSREQFVTDYLLVTDNNEKAYNQHMELARETEGIVSALSTILRHTYENRMWQVIESARHHKGDYTADLLSQLLNGWGNDAFDDIARHYIGLKTEQEVSA
jgi:hypothetical protein